MSLRSLFLLALAIVTPSIAYAQYEPDWNAKNFYGELHWCRSSIVFPAAADYERKGMAAGRSGEEIRGEVIAIIPASEAIASAGCYCALNELAKEISFASFTSDKAKIAGYLQGSKCKEATARAIRSMSRERAAELRLK